MLQRLSKRNDRGASVGVLLALWLKTNTATGAEASLYEQRAALPGQEPSRSEMDGAAAERVRARSPAAPSGAEQPTAPRSIEYRPFCDSGRCRESPDDELTACNRPIETGSKRHQDYSKLTLLTLGAGVSFAHLGHRWQAGPLGDGLTAIEASFVPLVSKGMAWFGFWGSLSRDSRLERSRLGLGVESGIGPWGLSAGPLVKIAGDGEGSAGLEARASFAAPIFYNRPDYERACCPAGSDLRSCACAHVVRTFLLEPDLRMEYWPHAPGPDVRIFAGLTGKFGLGF